MVVPKLHAVLPLDSRIVTVGTEQPLVIWSAGSPAEDKPGSFKLALRMSCLEIVQPLAGFSIKPTRCSSSYYMCEVFEDADFLGTAAG